MRPRGLKLTFERVGNCALKSRPMRPRGLKLPSQIRELRSLASRPMRPRGLKHFQGVKLPDRRRVAAHAAAWIETVRYRVKIIFVKSRPMRPRGLKHGQKRETRTGGTSRPMRPRGLKRAL